MRVRTGAAKPVAAASRRASCGNRLLDAADDADFAALAPALEASDLAAGTVLFEPGDDVTHACFPCDGTAISFAVVLTDGHTAEAATIGCEGAIGVIISAGEKPAFARAVVQAPGRVWRLEAARLEAARHASPRLRDLIARYADCLLAQVLQSVACNALHPVEQRAARWLLTLQDRTDQDTLPVTQEALSERLGVRRTTITRIIGELEASGAIRHRRGRIEVISRPRLQRSACECYRSIREHFDRVAPGLYPRSPET